MILDEATSHLDNDNEVHVQAALDDGADRPHGDRHRPPAVDDPRRRPDRRARRRARSSSSAPTTSWSPSTAPTPPSCGPAQLTVAVGRGELVTAGPLADLRVVDLSTVIAGPNCARYLADFGADVIKVERPGGDSLRNMAWRDERDGEGLWWKLANRNKRTIVARPQGRRRPGDGAAAWSTTPTCSSRTSGPARSSASDSVPRCCTAATPASCHPGVRVRPGRPVRRATGLRHDRRGDVGLRGDQRRAGRAAAACRRSLSPTRSPALAAAFATMVALHSGRGQVVDVNLLETMFQLMGPLPSLYALTGEQQPRLGSPGCRTPCPAGRTAARTGGGSPCRRAATRSPARVMAAARRRRRRAVPTFAGRTAHRDELEER